MPEIRYWANQVQAANELKSSSKSKKQSDSKLFQSLILEKLTTPLGTSSPFDFGLNEPDMGALFNATDFIGNDFSALEDKLTKIKNQGMGKVWAAQMSAQLPIFDQNNNKKNAIGKNGLNDMIMLNVQEQMIKARKVLEKQIKTTKSVFASEEDKVNSLSETIRNIQAQITSASKQFDLTELEIKQKL